MRAITVMTIRTIARIESHGVGEGAAACALTPGGFGAAASESCPWLHGAQQGGGQRGHADEARAGVRADDRPDLRDELRLAPVDLAAAAGDALGELGRLDVLDEED